MFIKAMLFAFTIALSSLAHAEQSDYTIGAHALSFHADKQYETVTPGLYVRHNDTGATAGVYRNSEGGTSAYVGGTLSYKKLDLTIGAVIGYKRAKVLPMVVPSVKLTDNLRVALIVNPWDIKASAVHLAYEF